MKTKPLTNDVIAQAEFFANKLFSRNTTEWSDVKFIYLGAYVAGFNDALERVEEGEFVNELEEETNG